LNFGKVTLYGEAPFKAEIFGGEIFSCITSPCEIKAKIGTSQLIISKENFQQNSMEVDFKLWQKTDYNVTFKVNPYIEKTNVIPEKEKEFLYDIMFDSETKSYKLFEKSDEEKNALAYFPEEIKNPKIFGSKYSIIVSSQKNSYLINLTLKTKTPLPDFAYSAITEYKFSPDGNFFQFKTPDSSYWWIMDLSAKTISSPKQTKIENTLKTDWIYGNKIILVTQNFSVAVYEPIQDTFKNLGTFPEIKEYPQNIIAATNGGVIYIETKDQKLRIILE
jgi:hypothetical protein